MKLNKGSPRQELHDLLITRAVIASFVILLSFFLLSFVYKDGLNYGLIKLSHYETTGKIIDAKYVERLVFFEYQFSDVENNEVKGKYRKDTYYDDEILLVGDDVEVIASKFLPQFNSIKSKLYQLEASFYIFSFCVTVIMFLLITIIWNTQKYYQFKEESERY